MHKKKNTSLHLLQYQLNIHNNCIGLFKKIHIIIMYIYKQINQTNNIYKHTYFIYYQYPTKDSKTNGHDLLLDISKQLALRKYDINGCRLILTTGNGQHIHPDYSLSNCSSFCSIELIKKSIRYTEKNINIDKDNYFIVICIKDDRPIESILNKCFKNLEFLESDYTYKKNYREEKLEQYVIHPDAWDEIDLFNNGVNDNSFNVKCIFALKEFFENTFINTRSIGYQHHKENEAVRKLINRTSVKQLHGLGETLIIDFNRIYYDTFGQFKIPFQITDTDNCYVSLQGKNLQLKRKASMCHLGNSIARGHWATVVGSHIYNDNMDYFIGEKPSSKNISCIHYEVVEVSSIPNGAFILNPSNDSFSGVDFKYKVFDDELFKKNLLKMFATIAIREGSKTNDVTFPKDKLPSSHSDKQPKINLIHKINEIKNNIGIRRSNVSNGSKGVGHSEPMDIDQVNFDTRYIQDKKISASSDGKNIDGGTHINGSSKSKDSEMANSKSKSKQLWELIDKVIGNSKGIGNSNNAVGKSSTGVGKSYKGVGKSSKGVSNSKGVGNCSKSVGNNSKGVGNNSKGIDNRKGVGNNNNKGIGNSKDVGNNSKGVDNSNKVVGNSNKGVDNNSSTGVGNSEPMDFDLVHSNTQYKQDKKRRSSSESNGDDGYEKEEKKKETKKRSASPEFDHSNQDQPTKKRKRNQVKRLVLFQLLGLNASDGSVSDSGMSWFLYKSDLPAFYATWAKLGISYYPPFYDGNILTINCCKSVADRLFKNAFVLVSGKRSIRKDILPSKISNAMGFEKIGYCQGAYGCYGITNSVYHNKKSFGDAGFTKSSDLENRNALTNFMVEFKKLHRGIKFGKITYQPYKNQRGKALSSKLFMLKSFRNYLRFQKISIALNVHKLARHQLCASYYLYKHYHKRQLTKICFAYKNIKKQDSDTGYKTDNEKYLKRTFALVESRSPLLVQHTFHSSRAVEFLARIKNSTLKKVLKDPATTTLHILTLFEYLNLTGDEEKPMEQEFIAFSNNFNKETQDAVYSISSPLPPSITCMVHPNEFGDVAFDHVISYGDTISAWKFPVIDTINLLDQITTFSK